MRILITAMYLFRDHPTGPGRFACDLAQEFANLGHEVWVIARAVHAQTQEYEQVGGVHLLRYYLPQWRGVALPRHKQHFKEAHRLLRTHLREFPEVIHGNDLLIYYAVMKYYRGHKRSFYSIHSPAVDELQLAWKSKGLKGRVKCLFGLRIIRRIERHILQNSAGLDAKSQFVKDLIQKQYGTEIAGRIRVIPGWVDTQRFQIVDDTSAIRNEMNWPAGVPVLFVLRRLESRMGMENLLHALAEVRRMGFDYFAVIGGTGSLMDSLMSLRDRLSLQDRVNFIGKVPDEKLPQLYGGCDASVMPTEQLEGFGIPILEAMACGKPVLVTPVGAMPEIVHPFEPRWIARSAHSTDLAELLGSYLNNMLPTHAPEQIRAHVEESFSREKAYGRYSDLLGLDRGRH